MSTAESSVLVAFFHVSVTAPLVCFGVRPAIFLASVDILSFLLFIMLVLPAALPECLLYSLFSLFDSPS